MPRLSEQRREERRRHILTSAWGCFSRNGFHATSMDDVIAATGMSSSAVYRYFRSKDELIAAAADEGLALVRDLLSVRRREIVPRLARARFGDAAVEDNGVLTAHWRLGDGTLLHLLANLSDQVVNLQTEVAGTKIWGGDLSDAISPWAVHWHIGQR